MAVDCSRPRRFDRGTPCGKWTSEVRCQCTAVQARGQQGFKSRFVPNIQEHEVPIYGELLGLNLK